MKNATFLAAMILLLATGCVHKGVKYLNDGILTVGITQGDFLEVWGKPSRTSIAGSREFMEASYHFGPRFKKGTRQLEMWEYADRDVQLIFEERRLIEWKNDVSKTANKPPVEHPAEKPKAKRTNGYDEPFVIK